MNGSLEFSDFWFQGSFLLPLKTDGAGFSKKKFLAKNGEIGVKNMHFRAFLGNRSLDFSEFWYETIVVQELYSCWINLVKFV